MARPIEHDPEAVLNRAMVVFWKKGFEATSINDLVRATGLNSRSMYNKFKDKNGLFLAVLEHYRSEVMETAFGQLQKHQGLLGIHKFFEVFLSQSIEVGCLYVNALAEKDHIDPSCYENVESFFHRLLEQFTSNLQQAVQSDEWQGDIRLMSSQLIVLWQGIAQYTKLKQDPELQKQVMLATLNSLGVRGQDS